MTQVSGPFLGGLGDSSPLCSAHADRLTHVSAKVGTVDVCGLVAHRETSSQKVPKGQFPYLKEGQKTFVPPTSKFCCKD